jgi:hypothetical protein
MYVALWLLMVIAPLFVIVALWTNLTRLLSIKIITTVVCAFFVFCVYLMGQAQVQIEKDNWTIQYAVNRDTDYVKCLNDNSKDFDKMMDNCVIPNVKLLRETYDM